MKLNTFIDQHLFEVRRTTRIETGYVVFQYDGKTYRHRFEADESPLDGLRAASRKLQRWVSSDKEREAVASAETEATQEAAE